MKVSIKYFFRKRDQIRGKLPISRIWSHLQKKYFVFCAVNFLEDRLAAKYVEVSLKSYWLG